MKTWLKQNQSERVENSRFFTEEDLHDKNRQTFNYDEFREGQKEVILATLQGRDSFVLWATGSGKSLCYMFPPLLSKKISFVVSPLISLMEDQVHKVNQIPGLSATHLSCNQTQRVFDDVLAGKYQVVFLTPERVTVW